MNYEMYAPVLEKARATLAQKTFQETMVAFDTIGVSALTVKLFWFVSGVKRKLKRRFGK